MDRSPHPGRWQELGPPSVEWDDATSVWRVSNRLRPIGCIARTITGEFYVAVEPWNTYTTGNRFATIGQALDALLAEWDRTILEPVPMDVLMRNIPR